MAKKEAAGLLVEVFEVARPRRTPRLTDLFVFLLASACGWAQDAQPAPCSSPSSTLPLMTYDEDVQYLAKPECRINLTDSIQFIPLDGNNESRYLSFGFWLRERGEYESNPNFSNRPSGNAYLLQRYLLHADLHLSERFRFFGELASSLLNGRNG